VIGRLTGRVVAQEPDGTIVLDVAGVGYELAAPLGTLGRAPVDDAGRVTLWVHTHVREDALALFAFSDAVERAAFRALISVSNVGPKIAVAVLGAIPANELARAVATRNLSALTAISGVGKKIAERLLLELRGKLPETPPAASGAAQTAGASVPSGRGHGVDDRLRSALVGLGFRPAEAERAIQTVTQSAAARPVAGSFEELLREALGLLAK
jgi:Holliday junction DNA helicase RuvA